MRRIKYPILKCLLAVCIAFSALPGVTADPGTGLYHFGTTENAALEAYRRGWLEILEYGSWQEAEAEYRKALNLDPDFLIVRAVLARLQVDAERRGKQEQFISARMHLVDSDGRLVLDPYVKTLELMRLRDRKHPELTNLRDQLAEMAVANYRRFLDKYPREWSVLIEYIEWVHALNGAQAALDEIATLSENPTIASRGFSYFPAYFYAELGQIELARQHAEAFALRLAQSQPGKDLPQTHYINAYIAFEDGDLPTARASIERALELEPKHIVAQRLSVEIDKAMAADSD